LQRRPQRALRKPRRDLRGGEHEAEIAHDTDRDLQEPEDETLDEHAAARRVDELRQQRQVEQRDLGIQDAGEKADAKKPARRILRQYESGKRPLTARPYGTTSDPQP